MMVFAFGGVATPMFANVALAGYGQDKVKICHKGKTKEVPAPAVPGHLKHGDTLGKCPNGTVNQEELLKLKLELLKFRVETAQALRQVREDIRELQNLFKFLLAIQKPRFQHAFSSL